jgi:hypothetical protein
MHWLFYIKCGFRNDPLLTSDIVGVAFNPDHTLYVGHVKH